MSQEELMYALEHEGMEVAERTIRFWISKGVLEQPLRKPYKHADGRKKYFPTRVVGEIADILRLQEEGWKLAQIKRRLRTSVKPASPEAAGAEELGRRLLADFLSNGEFKDRVKMIDSADSATPAWRRVRNFLVARLTHFVGRKQAVRSVTSFMLGLSKRDTAKLLRLTSGQRSDQITREEADKIWNAEEKRALRGVMRSLEQPVWGASTLEPLISRRLRKEISSLRAALMRA
ncbi:MAG: MerR family transcriptional regulator, partial [Candidatus Eremiobacteraeota bacterium]|nr:MerR family transcriptional regulator [Candidatus Eremiobacteraeota bacterium]